MKDVKSQMLYSSYLRQDVKSQMLYSSYLRQEKPETIERYRRHTKDAQTNNKSIEQNMQHLKHEAATMMKKIEHLEVSKRRLLGEGLGTCSLEELQQIEEQLERSVSSIRARKAQVFKEQIEQLKEKCGIQPQQGSNEPREIIPYEESSPSSDVETELFIGPPEGRTKRSRLQN
ncbi:mads-box protein soc1 [Quercus suber]|uniref:Mads-box protein soc1 n=1 Tax=Quercus suber TaxID=58331 RepID=A0AAW0LP57_QUESU